MEDQRLILRYRFEAKPGVYWTNILKIARKDDFFQIYINNGNDKMSQFRLHKDQAKELMEFIKNSIDNEDWVDTDMSDDAPFKSRHDGEKNR